MRNFKSAECNINDILSFSSEKLLLLKEYLKSSKRASDEISNGNFDNLNRFLDERQSCIKKVDDSSRKYSDALSSLDFGNREKVRAISAGSTDEKAFPEWCHKLFECIKEQNSVISQISDVDKFIMDESDKHLRSLKSSIESIQKQKEIYSKYHVFDKFQHGSIIDTKDS